MKNTKSKILVASAVAIMLAPAALNALPQRSVSAEAIGTVSNATPVYDANGKATGTTLPSGSQWKLGTQITLNGVAHYMVGTNEYIPASAVSNVTGSANSSDDFGGKVATNYFTNDANTGKVGTATSVLDIVDANGNSTGRTLPSGSQWRLGKVLHANKQLYYQVSTNEFVSALDITVVGQDNNDNTTTSSYITSDTNNGKTGVATTELDVVDGNGKSTGLTLPKGSAWKVGKILTVNKETFYQIATNEWVLAVNLKFADDSTTANNINTSESYVTTSTNSGKTGVAITDLNVIDNNGNDTGKIIAKGSAWKLGSALHANKQVYYQIATNQWILSTGVSVDSKKVSAADSIPTPGHGLVGTTNSALKTYNTETNSYDRTLPANSSWKISKLVVNKYGSFWGQVSSNEWVWITNVRLNSGLNLKENSVYEPDFATKIAK